MNNEKIFLLNSHRLHIGKLFNRRFQTMSNSFLSKKKRKKERKKKKERKREREKENIKINEF